MLVLAAVAAVVATAAVAQAAGPSINAGPQAGIVWERAQAQGHAGHNQSPDPRRATSSPRWRR